MLWAKRESERCDGDSNMKTLCRRLLVLVIVLGVSVVINGCCVAAGTLIATPQGDKPVESLAVGDAVLTLSPSGDTEHGRIVRIKRHLSLGCNTISLTNGKQIRVTQWHPVSTRSGWVKAANLEKGRELQTLTGFQRITDIKSELKLQTVYDLSIAPNPNFIATG
jgi:hypothetical protein